MKIEITEEMEIHKLWFDQAKHQTRETLMGFINDLLEGYGHDYGTICHAISAGALATMYAMNASDEGGITGNQADFIMWGIITHWLARTNCAMRLLEFDDMLYPQYAYKFNSITKSIWEDLQKKARECLAASPAASPAVIAHWQSMVDGVPPFGYSLEEGK